MSAVNLATINLLPTQTQLLPKTKTEGKTISNIEVDAGYQYENKVCNSITTTPSRPYSSYLLKTIYRYLIVQDASINPNLRQYSLNRHHHPVNPNPLNSQHIYYIVQGQDDLECWLVWYQRSTKYYAQHWTRLYNRLGKHPE